MKWISSNHISQSAGFTLTEVMMTLAIAAIVLSIGVPSFQTMFQNNRKSTSINDMRTALALARSTAITRRTRTTVCKSSDNVRCADPDDGDWTLGWIVFVDPNNAGTRDLAVDDGVDEDEELLRVHSALSGSASFSGNGTVANRVSFSPQGLFTNGFGGTLTYDDPRGPEYGGRLIISSGGQVRYEEGSS